MDKDLMMKNVFGPQNANMKKGLCINVLHFLDNDDLYNQSLGAWYSLMTHTKVAKQFFFTVSKDFCKLSLDGALWDYPADNLTM